MSNEIPLTSEFMQHTILLFIVIVVTALSFVYIDTAVASELKYGWGDSGNSISAANVYGADANPTGNPIGGGVGYKSIFLTGNYLVSTADELVNALARASAGQIVYVKSGVEIDLTHYTELQVPGGVTLAGDRGNGTSPGPLLFTRNTRATLISDAGPGVRITGLRIRGADGGVDPIDYIYDNLAFGIRSTFANLEVDNCEISDFSFAGVQVVGKNGYVHHNYIHHVQREGLGYPVQVGGTALIEANIFDYYRHAIAASGFPGNGYEARYNIALAHATNTVFDMHGGADFCYKAYSVKPTCTDDEWWMAGDWISIHHNTIMEVVKIGVGIRGVPWEFGEVHHNWFMTTNTKRAFTHIYFSGNVAVFDNVYGASKLHLASDIEPSALVRDLGGLSRKGITVSSTNSIVDINEHMTGTQLHIGFTSPPDDENTLEVQGTLPVEVEINHGGLLEIQQVKILLDDKVIYSSKEVPVKGTLQIDTEQLADQLHTLTLLITDARGGDIKRTTRFKPANWLIMVDEFLPPIQSGSFFSGLNLSRTEQESSGWSNTGSQTDRLFDDANRKTRKAATTEYLIYHSPFIRRFSVVLYTNTDAFQTDAFTIYTSSDGVNWEPISYSVSEEGRQGDWHSLVIKGELSDLVSADWLKVSVGKEIPATALQLGRIEICSANRK